MKAHAGRIEAESSHTDKTFGGNIHMGPSPISSASSTSSQAEMQKPGPTAVRSQPSSLPKVTLSRRLSAVRLACQSQAWRGREVRAGCEWKD